MYEDWDWQHRAEVEFEMGGPAEEQVREASPHTQCITLEITAPNQEEAEIWNCYSVTPPQVEITTSDITLKHVKL